MPPFPREHGAYGQMLFPLATSFAVAGVSMPAVLLGLAVVAGFLAHEPVLVLLGRRGPRARREQRRAAAVWLGVTTAVLIGAGAAALFTIPSSTRWSLALPLGPALFLAAAIAARQEKRPAAEIAVALAFSLAAVPICLAAGAQVATACAVGAAFALVFVPATLVVRAILIDVRGRGSPRASRLTRAAVLILAGAAALGFAAAASRGLLAWTTLMAAAPGLAASSWMAVFPPRPSRLRAVGWTLVAVSTIAALVLIAGLPA
jgi:hypothetical protein